MASSSDATSKTARLLDWAQTATDDARRLAATHGQLFAEPMTVDRAASLRGDDLPNSADAWVDVRALRNRLIHECVRSAADLATTLDQCAAAVPLRIAAAERMATRIRRS